MGNDYSEPQSDVQRDENVLVSDFIGRDSVLLLLLSLFVVLVVAVVLVVCCWLEFVVLLVVFLLLILCLLFIVLLAVIFVPVGLVCRVIALPFLLPFLLRHSC